LPSSLEEHLYGQEQQYNGKYLPEDVRGNVLQQSCPDLGAQDPSQPDEHSYLKIHVLKPGVCKQCRESDNKYGREGCPYRFLGGKADEHKERDNDKSPAETGKTGSQTGYYPGQDE